jgi:hypothetical protein
MEEIKLTILELYGIRNQLAGIVVNELKIKGFINESGLSEGIKRRANRVLKIVLNELEPINTQLDVIRISKDTVKEKELLSDTITISIEKLDFVIIENISLSDNYQLLYETIFKNS